MYEKLAAYNATKALSGLLGVAPSRVTVEVRTVGPDSLGKSSCRMVVLLDDKEPEGRHREIILKWVQSTLRGKLEGSV